MEPQVRKVRRMYKGKGEQTLGPKPELILKEICQIFDAPLEEVAGKSRKTDMVLLRQLYYYVCCTITNANQQLIADLVGKERSAISYHLVEVRSWMENGDDAFMKKWRKYTDNSVLWLEYGKTLVI